MDFKMRVQTSALEGLSRIADERQADLEFSRVWDESRRLVRAVLRKAREALLEISNHPFAVDVVDENGCTVLRLKHAKATPALKFCQDTEKREIMCTATNDLLAPESFEPEKLTEAVVQDKVVSFIEGFLGSEVKKRRWNNPFVNYPG